MKWHNEKRKLSELIPYEMNPRQLSVEQHEHLTASLKKFDLAEVPAINTDNTIVAGHQRVRILAELHGLDYEVDVRVPDKKLTKADFEEYLVRSNLNTGEWDFDQLANHFDTEDLVEWGFDDSDFNLDFSDANKEIDVEDFEDNIELKFKLSQDEYAHVTSQLSTIDENKELALLKILEYAK